MKREPENGPALEEMISDTGGAPVPGHDKWFRRQVQKALDEKNSGQAKYTDFWEVAAEFGFKKK